MKLHKLSSIDALLIYQTHLPRDFHSNEIRPLNEVALLVESGLYYGYGLYEKDELVGYAFACSVHSSPCVLLDFCAIRPIYRSNGYGTLLIQLLREAFLELNQEIVIEVESPSSAFTDVEQHLSQRRIAFYLRCGMVHTKVHTALQGREYLVMHLPNELHLTDTQIQAELCHIYAAVFYEDVYGHRLLEPAGA